MLRRIIASIAVSGTLAQASTGTSYSFNTESACSTVWASTGTVPASLPTSSTSSTISTLITNTEVTVPVTSTVTVETVTTTVSVQSAYTYTATTVTIPTSTSWQRAESIVATATLGSTVCTNGVTPYTVTEYDGDYTPTSGQVTKLPTPFPSQVICTTAITWLTILHPTATSGLTTVTGTSTSTVVAPTLTTSTSTYTATATVWDTTVTSVTTSYRLHSTVATVSTACEATTTTTFAAKCAPTNVIAGIGEHGLVSGRYAENVTVIYISDDKYNDPSACCQLCQDNEGCGALYAGFDGACGLLYVGAANGGPACDFVYTYQTQSNVFPGQGLWVQSGCGEIDYTGSDGV